MKPAYARRVPAALESAVQRIRQATRDAVDRSVEALGIAAMSAPGAAQRDALLAAQTELGRKSAFFAAAFDEAWDDRVARDIGGPAAASGADAPPAAPGASEPRWDTLSLVDDREVEATISAERFGRDIGLACEWELRELDGYVAAVLGGHAADPRRNPLRPELIGQAMTRALGAVTNVDDQRKLLATEIARSLASLLPSVYAESVARLRQAGVRPVALSLRTGKPPAGTDAPPASRGHTAPAGTGDAGPEASADAGVRHPVAGQAGVVASAGWTSRATPSGGSTGRHTPAGHAPPASGRTTTSPADLREAEAAHGRAGATRGDLGRVDAGLMTLLRRLARRDPQPAPTAPRGGPADVERVSAAASVAAAPVNLIHAHREALRAASPGFDHVMIDVVGSLFDQVLADPKVPPQVARQIARLQLPVLRAALGDPTFFSSRRHPVRRFVNRIASLGAAFDDFEGDDAAQRLLDKVRDLVQAVVAGDFDRIETYDEQLQALEAFVAEQSALAARTRGHAAEILAQREDEQRLHRLYAQRLEGDLRQVAGPPFVRDFISKVWSQVLLRAASSERLDPAFAARMKLVGRDLFMSVQPKANAAQRKAFLAELPRLMQNLTAGLDLIEWPEAARRDFFAQLMPAHADALRNAAGSQLEANLLARQVETVLERPPPSRDELPPVPADGGGLGDGDDAAAEDATTPARAAGAPAAVGDTLPAPKLSAEEALRVGLVPESAVDWTSPPQADPEVGAEAPPPGARPPPQQGDAVAAAAAGGASTTASPALAAPVAPSSALDPDALQVGFAYRMQLQQQWQKVRLSHVSAARGFFVFTHGAGQRETLSLTRRMLVRLCQAGRLRPFETAYLLERASARARLQLAAVQRSDGAARHTGGGTASG